MARYCQRDDLYNHLSQKVVAELSDDDTNGTVINKDLVDALLDDSEALINTYLRGTHPLPIIPIPRTLQSTCAHLTIFLLYKRRMPDEIPESVLEMYSQSVTYLQAVKNGEQLLLDEDATPNTGKKYNSNKTKDSRLMMARENGTSRLDEFYCYGE